MIHPMHPAHTFQLVPGFCLPSRLRPFEVMTIQHKPMSMRHRFMYMGMVMRDIPRTAIGVDMPVMIVVVYMDVFMLDSIVGVRQFS